MRLARLRTLASSLLVATAILHCKRATRTEAPASTAPERAVAYTTATPASALAPAFPRSHSPTAATHDPPALRADLADLQTRLRATVTTLARDIGERHVGRPIAYAKAAAFLRAQLRGAGYEVKDSQYEVQGVACVTLEATLRGTQRTEELVLVGAHYDSAQGTPGADDNASGVAVLLELARWARSAPPPARSLRFVLFPNEEPPHFRDERTMGSLRYAATAKAAGAQLSAVVVLETLGFYSQRAGRQRMPRGLDAPQELRGDFVAIVGNTTSADLVHALARAYVPHSTIAARPIVAPKRVQGIDWSDHASFWRHGYPAVMVTDTALFRNPHYHRATDTADTLDYAALARVAYGLWRAVHALADAPP